MGLSKKISAIREAETSGRQEFCDLVGVNKGTLARIEQTGQIPRGDLLERICAEWPHYTLWLMTGYTDPRCGQISPPDERLRNHHDLETRKASG